MRQFMIFFYGTLQFIAMRQQLDCRIPAQAVALSRLGRVVAALSLWEAWAGQTAQERQWNRATAWVRRDSSKIDLSIAINRFCYRPVAPRLSRNSAVAPGLSGRPSLSRATALRQRRLPQAGLGHCFWAIVQAQERQTAQQPGLGVTAQQQLN